MIQNKSVIYIFLGGLVITFKFVYEPCRQMVVVIMYYFVMIRDIEGHFVIYCNSCSDNAVVMVI